MSPPLGDRNCTTLPTRHVHDVTTSSLPWLSISRLSPPIGPLIQTSSEVLLTLMSPTTSTLIFELGFCKRHAPQYTRANKTPSQV